MQDQLPKADYNFVWCRWVVSFVNDPPLLIKKLGAIMPKGSVAIFHEYGHYETWRFFPRLPMQERFREHVIATWRDDVYSAEAVLDDDGRGHDDIVIRAKVEKRGSDLTVDLSASDPEVTSFVNSSYANMRAGVAAALAYLIDSDTPKNDGAFRPLKVIAKPGTVVWANAGAPVTLCTSHCGNEIIEVDEARRQTW